MINIKTGVTLLGMVPQMMLSVRVLEALYEKRGATLVITAGNDGKHTRASEHYGGRAVDLRTFNLSPVVLTSQQIAKEIVAEAKIALGPDFFVQFETNPDHIHVHYEPKGPATT